MKINFEEDCILNLYLESPSDELKYLYISFCTEDCDDPEEAIEFITETICGFTFPGKKHFQKIDIESELSAFGDEFEDTVTFKIKISRRITKEVIDSLKSFIDIPTLYRKFNDISLYKPESYEYDYNIFFPYFMLKDIVDFIEFLQNAFNESLTKEERLLIEAKQL